MNASTIAATNVSKREYQKDYIEYWNSTKGLTGNGRPVDAFIAPVAPFPAARPTTYTYYGYTTIINLLDYTACSIPVTLANKEVDVIDKGFKPFSDDDRESYERCKSSQINA